MNSKPKVLHIITGLRRGGAETMLINLLTFYKEESCFEHIILSLISDNDFHEEIKITGIKVYSLNIRSFALFPFYFIKLNRMVNSINPSIIQGWLYHGNIAVKISKMQLPYLFSIHNSLTSIEKEKWLTRKIIKLGSLFSFRTNGIIYCSQVSLIQHEAIGYSKRKSIYIPNGFDTKKFHPDIKAKIGLKDELKIPNENLVFGQIARFHPIKNQLGLLRAFGELIKTMPLTSLVMIGENVNNSNSAIIQVIHEYNLEEKVHLLGLRNNIDLLISGLDVLVSPSFSEAFPIVVGEAMACGVPCIATDVGDSADVIGDAGIIVEPDNEEALVKAMKYIALLSVNDRVELGKKARLRIIDNFGLKIVAERYEQLYISLLNPD